LTRLPPAHIEELINELSDDYNGRDRHAQHAAGCAAFSDYTGRSSTWETWSKSPTRQVLFTKPSQSRTEDYITGRFG